MVWTIFILSMLIGFVALAQEPVSPAPTASTVELQRILLWTTIAGFVFQFLVMLFKAWQEKRQRAWDLEDRAIARAAAAKQVSDVSQKVDDVSHATAELDRGHRDLSRKIDENIKMSAKRAEDTDRKIAEFLQQIMNADLEKRHHDGGP
jgi:biopolymer transport protein ExbB/TolQ